MLLSRTQIKEFGLVQNPVEKQYRAAGYDITIDRIINDHGDDVGDGYKLPPSGVVEVISREKIVLPSYVSGYAFIRTTLCNKGVLALNIGIVDPGYEGLLSTTLVNFGKSVTRISKGETFLRLVFHKYNQEEDIPKTGVDDEKYVNDRKTEALNNFGSTFLQTDQIAKSAAKQAITDNLGRVTWHLPLFAILVSIVIAVVTIGVSWGLNQIAMSDVTRAWAPEFAAERVEGRLNEAVANRREVLDKIGDLEKRLDSEAKMLELQDIVLDLKNELVELRQAITKMESQQSK